MRPQSIKSVYHTTAATKGRFEADTHSRKVMAETATEAAYKTLRYLRSKGWTVEWVEAVNPETNERHNIGVNVI